MSASQGPTSEVIESIERAEDETTLTLAGELDVSTIGPVRDVLEEECARKPTRLVIDLAAVDFIDSSALHAFVAANRSLGAEGCSLRITGASDVVRRTFEITQLDMVLLAPTNGNGRL
jgi:anti-sigma B factor antagonist